MTHFLRYFEAKNYQNVFKTHRIWNGVKHPMNENIIYNFATTVVSGHLQYRLPEIFLLLKARAVHQFGIPENNVSLPTFLIAFIESANRGAQVYV